MNLSNCPQCGKVYVQNSYSLCGSCLKDIEEQYRRCADYLRSNRSCNIHELSEATDVTVRMIARFIREGRIAAKDAPHVRMPCESCGEPIQEGMLCNNCRSRLAKDFSQVQGEAGRKGARQGEYDHSGTYMKDRDKFGKQ